MTRPRLWAVVPGVALVLMTVHNLAEGTPEALLWVCNLSTVALTLALLLDHPVWAKTAALWLAVGAPFWLQDTVVTGDWLPHSFITHLVCPVIGVAYVRSRPPASGAWWRGAALIIAGTLTARFATPTALNVNNSQQIAPSMDTLFTNYWSYFAFHAVGFAVALFVLEWAADRTILRRPVP